MAKRKQVEDPFFSWHRLVAIGFLNKYIEKLRSKISDNDERQLEFEYKILYLEEVITDLNEKNVV